MSEDFDDRVDIIPVSDHNAGTMTQRIMQYQAALQLAAQAPQMYDMPLLHRQMLEVLGIQDADKIVPTENDMKPTDPVSENMNIINGDPVKAFIYQDHEAHIQTHMSAVENPQIIGLLKKAPNAKAIEAAMSAHIQEHVAFAYRQKIEKQLGVALPAPDESLPEDIELRLSRLVAPAAEQVTGKAQQMAQAEENAKQQQDPVIQMQQKELQIQEGKAVAKAQSDMARIQLDLQKAQEKVAFDRDNMESKERIASAKIGAQVASDNIKKDGIESKEAIEGVKIGIDLVQDLIDND